MKKIYIKISKFLSYILRHGPDKVGLELDSNGFADLNEVLKVLNQRFKNFKVNITTLEEIIEQSEKKRFQIKNSKIRAFYGHSLDEKIIMKLAEDLPPILYHGTNPKAYKAIKTIGLIKKKRQYVHLSKNMETAILVGKRKANNPLIIIIDVISAQNEGIKFYKSGDMYLADFIPPKFIKKANQ
ncbi:MAG: RNA 2'-phosphotransferase [Promethearchaeota archaeon]